ncbi:hypothetical protein OJE16_08710 [Pantoea tagorei]
MQDFSLHIQHETDRDGKEMTQRAVWQRFCLHYGVEEPRLKLMNAESHSDGDLTQLEVSLSLSVGTRRLRGRGNGLLSAAIDALQHALGLSLTIEDYHEHTLGKRSDSRSVAYLCCLDAQGKRAWGVSIDSDIARASLQALFNAAAAFLPPQTRLPGQRPADDETSR